MESFDPKQIYRYNAENQVRPIDIELATTVIAELPLESILSDMDLDFARIKSTISDYGVCEHNYNYIANRLIFFLLCAEELVRRGHTFQIHDDFYDETFSLSDEVSFNISSNILFDYPADEEAEDYRQHSIEDISWYSVE